MRDEALQELKERYGCETIEEAKQLVETERLRLEAAVADVERELSASDA